MAYVAGVDSSATATQAVVREPGRAYLRLSTGMVAGTYSPEYRWDRRHTPSAGQSRRRSSQRRSSSCGTLR
jgi:hypothetical protein